MKKSLIIAAFAALAVVSCKKTEVVNTDSSKDSAAMKMKEDSAAMKMKEDSSAMKMKEDSSKMKMEAPAKVTVEPAKAAEPAKAGEPAKVVVETPAKK